MKENAEKWVEEASLEFHTAFDKYKAKMVQLQKQLVGEVRLERYNAANKLKERMRTLKEEFPESVQRSLDDGGEIFVGQTVRHKQYGYRGVVLKCDATCKADDQWQLLRRVSTLPRGAEQPFYHILFNKPDRPNAQPAVQTTYIAEDLLEVALDAFPIEHELVTQIFTEVADLEAYVPNDTLDTMKDYWHEGLYYNNLFHLSETVDFGHGW